MIGRLRGLVAEVGEEEALIDVGGVGYLVRCGVRTLGRLPAPGQEALLHVDSHWSEAAGPRLYGFATREERRAFIALQAIQGVGPKAALGVLDVLGPDELAAAVARQDRAAVGQANGVGPKLAQRIVSELKDKPFAEGPVATAGDPGRPAVLGPRGEAVAALLGLGLTDIAARRAVDQAQLRLGETALAPALIRASLQELDR